MSSTGWSLSLSPPDPNTPCLHGEVLWEGGDSSGQEGAPQCSCGDRADRSPQPEEKAEPPMLSQSPAPSVSIAQVFIPTTALLLILNSTV